MEASSADFAAGKSQHPWVAGSWCNNGGGPCSSSIDKNHHLVVSAGVAAVAMEAALSGLSNVYFEKVLKSTSLSGEKRAGT
jgi:hypothetical protein